MSYVFSRSSSCESFFSFRIHISSRSCICWISHAFFSLYFPNSPCSSCTDLLLSTPLMAFQDLSLVAVSLISWRRRNFFTYFLVILALQKGHSASCSPFLKMMLLMQLRQQLCWEEQIIMGYRCSSSQDSEQMGQSNSICCFMKLPALILSIYNCDHHASRTPINQRSLACSDGEVGMNYKDKMGQITIINILDKIRSICKEAPAIALPDRVSSEQGVGNLQSYLKALESIRLQFIRHRNLQDEYCKLQQLLQRGETEVRKRIGIENQLKLYSESLKSQLEELESEKTDLLENTKTYIKQLKKTNEALFLELNLEINKNKHSSEQSHEKSRQKVSASKVSKFNRSQSHHRSKRDKSLKEIVRTEYIDREPSSSGRKKVKYHQAKREVHETISDTEGQQLVAKQNSRTLQVTRTQSGKKKEKGSQLDSKKKTNHLFSNPNFYSFFETSKKKVKKEKEIFGKSPGKEKKNPMQSRVQNPSRCLWKDKKINRSVYSVLSMQHNSTQKETI